MSKFRKEENREVPPVSTASLPDIIFMLLFFFMVTTTMRETTLKVKVKVPNASEITKLEKKSVVSVIYVGPPLQQYVTMYGNEPRIQLNDQFARINDITDFVEAERKSLDESEIPQMVMSLKIDEYTKMGIVAEIKQELRKAAALHISYSSRQKRAEK